MNRIKFKAAYLGVITTTVLVAACGGGGGGGGTSSPPSWSSSSTSSSTSTSSSSSSSTSSSSSSSSSAWSSSVAITDSEHVPAGYELVWADEFEKDGLVDEDNWLYDTEANRTGWYNNEKQYYAVRRLENARMEDGVLRITARKERLTTASDYGNQEYTSARLITRGKREFTYGFFEIRAKMPCGVGTWPAIWTLGVSASWPDGGEIDIMEHVGKDPETIVGTTHNRSTAGTWGNGNSITVRDACTAFNLYQIEWTENKIDWYVNGTKYHTYTNAGTGNAQWPYDKPHYLLLNQAIGGDMAGPVDDSIFPRTFEVDYVRVYQKN